MKLIGGGITVEVFLVVRISIRIWEAFLEVKNVVDFLEASEAAHRIGIDVHVLDLGVEDIFLILLFDNLLLIHLQLFLVLLDAHVHAVNQNISVDDVRNLGDCCNLFIAD